MIRFRMAGASALSQTSYYQSTIAGHMFRPRRCSAWTPRWTGRAAPRAAGLVNRLHSALKGRIAAGIRTFGDINAL
jgi:hypothetical protein